MAIKKYKAKLKKCDDCRNLQYIENDNKEKVYFCKVSVTFINECDRYIKKY